MVSGPAWERRDTESVRAYERFREFMALPRSERARFLRTSGAVRGWCRDHDWWARAAAHDDQDDHDYEQSRQERIREVRAFHARKGRELLEVAIARIDEATNWKPGDLVRLAELARRMETTAVMGSHAAMTGAARAVVSAAGGELDEWDRLAASLAETLPPER
jgi:hypothetical protein